MWPVTQRFIDTVQGSHRSVARCRLCKAVQFGANPVGDVVPLLAGSQVDLYGLADIKAQLRVVIPGEWWEEIEPFGRELFVERGVAFGDGQVEYVPLGYFEITDGDQGDQPTGPISIDADDRTVRLMNTRQVYPWQVPQGTTHRQVFESLVNGDDATETGTYGMYGAQGGPVVPIIWDDAGYDPDDAEVTGDQVVDDSAYDFLAKLVDARGAMIRFRPTGELAVVRRDPVENAPVVYTLRRGVTGTLKRQSRRVSNRGVFNIVRANGSDPAFQTGYRLAYLNDPTSKIRWNGPIGPRVRYLSSPLLTTSPAADEAAETLLARSTGLPLETALWAVPNPALQPLDVVSAPTGTGFGNVVLDEISIPLVGGGEVQLRTRTLHPVAVIETDPTPEPDPGPGPDPDPDPGPGPGTGGGDPSDGTQAAILNGWGPVIDGDEFVGTTINTAKWGLYNGPGHTGNGTRRPAAFSQHDGMLTITGDNNDQSGGAAFKRGSFGYRIECRIRCYRDGDSPGRTDRYHPVLILWPDSDQWPEGAEYDYAEYDEGEGAFGLFMHLPNHTPYRQDHYSQPFDTTQFHNVACEWNPSARTLKTWLNGTLVYSGSGRVADAPGPMHPTFQLDHFGGKPRRAKFDMQFMRIYAKPNP